MENFTGNDTTEVENIMSTAGVTEAYNSKNDVTKLENGIAPSEVEKVQTEDSSAAAEDNTHANENIQNEGNHEATAAVDNSVENGHEHDGNTVVMSDEKKWPGWPGETVFRILVPQYRVGGLIGKKGDIIKKITEESKARIKVLDAAPGTPERPVIVSAKDEPDLPISPAIDALLKVHNRIIEGLAGEALAPSKSGKPEVTRLLAGATQAGTLIGKQGSNIKSIQDASSCSIRVIDDIPPFALLNDKVIEIQGEPSGMHKALELVASHLRKYLVDRSVLPIFEKEMLRPMSHQPNLPPPHPWAPPPHTGKHGYNPDSHYMPPPPSHDNYHYPPPQHDISPPHAKLPHHGISAFGRDASPKGGHSSNGSQSTQHMQVPISYADAVIGPSGSTISYIRRTSGAVVTIHETKGVPGEMTVEISGTASQIQTAQQLIQNYMAESNATVAHSTAPLSAADAYSNGSTYTSSGYTSAPAYGAYSSAIGSSYGY